MRKIVSLVLVVFMVLGCLSLVACGDGEGEEENGTPSNGASLDEILGRVAGIDSVMYTISVTIPGAPTQIKWMWEEDNKMRSEMTEDGETIVILANFDEEVTYMYQEGGNVAIKSHVSDAPEYGLLDHRFILEYSPEVVGTETLDGNACLVVGYTKEQKTIKMWIWKEHGIPIRMETTTAEGTIITEFEYIYFGGITDDTFELPEGVEVIEF